MKTSIDSAGRIQLPVYLQSQLGVKPGDEITLEKENGNWLIKPVMSSADGLPNAYDDDDLNWEEIEYMSVPPSRLRQVAVQIRHRGRLKPLAHDLDNE